MSSENTTRDIYVAMAQLFSDVFRLQELARYEHDYGPLYGNARLIAQVNVIQQSLDRLADALGVRGTV